MLELYTSVDGVMPDPGLRLGVRVNSIAEALRAIGQSIALRQSQWGLRALVRDRMAGR